MADLIPPTIIKVGQDVSSGLIIFDETLLYEATAERLGTDDSVVRVVVENEEPLGRGRADNTKVLLNTDSTFIDLDSSPSPVRFRIECLLGVCKVGARTVGRDVPLTPTVIPGPSHYLGTNPLGAFGYHPLPVGGGSHVHIWNETPVGTIDGVTTAFTLAVPPNPANSLLLFKNGILMRAGASDDFTLSGLTITYNAGQIPQVGDTHIASYTTL